MAKKAAKVEKKKDDYSLEDLRALAVDINGSELFEDTIEIENAEDLEEAIEMIKEVIVEDDVCQIYTTDSLNKNSFKTLELIGCPASVPDEDEEEEEEASEDEEEEEEASEDEEEEPVKEKSKIKKKEKKAEAEAEEKPKKKEKKAKAEKKEGDKRGGNAEALQKARDAKKNKWGHAMGSQADKIDQAIMPKVEKGDTEISVSAIAKKIGISKSRIKSHAKHLIDKKGVELTLVD